MQAPHQHSPQSSTPHSLVNISQLCLNIRQQQFDLLQENILHIYTATFSKASIRIALSILTFDCFQLSGRFQDPTALSVSTLDKYLEHHCDCTKCGRLQAYSAIRWTSHHPRCDSATCTSVITLLCVLGRAHVACLQGAGDSYPARWNQGQADHLESEAGPGSKPGSSEMWQQTADIAGSNVLIHENMEAIQEEKHG